MARVRTVAGRLIAAMLTLDAGSPSHVSAAAAVGVAASLKNRFSAADILKNMPASLGVRGGGKQSFAQGSFSGEYDAMQQFQVDITSALIAMV